MTVILKYHRHNSHGAHHNHDEIDSQFHDGTSRSTASTAGPVGKGYLLLQSLGYVPQSTRSQREDRRKDQVQVRVNRHILIPDLPSTAAHIPINEMSAPLCPHLE